MLTSESSAATTKTLRQSRRTDGLSGSERSDIDKVSNTHSICSVCCIHSLAASPYQ